METGSVFLKVIEEEFQLNLELGVTTYSFSQQRGNRLTGLHKLVYFSKHDRVPYMKTFCASDVNKTENVLFSRLFYFYFSFFGSFNVSHMLLPSFFLAVFFFLESLAISLLTSFYSACHYLRISYLFLVVLMSFVFLRWIAGEEYDGLPLHTDRSFLSISSSQFPTLCSRSYPSEANETVCSPRATS